MKKPSPTTIIYHTEAGYDGQEVRWNLKEKDKPEVDKPFISYGSDDLGTLIIPKDVKLYWLGPSSKTAVYSIVCEIPKTITVTMGCGHTQTVPNESEWIIADGAPNTKCEACWKQIAHDLYKEEGYNASNCYEDYYGF